MIEHVSFKNDESGFPASVREVGFNLFCHAARSIGFPGSVKLLFEELDTDEDGVVRPRIPKHKLHFAKIHIQETTT